MQKFGLQYFAADGYVNIYSNDGVTSLFNQGVSISFTSTVTDTGLAIEDNGDTFIYTYNGSKRFLGFATTPNATEPTYTIGSTISYPILQYHAPDLYIVESKSSSYKFQQLYDRGAVEPAGGYTLTIAGDKYWCSDAGKETANYVKVKIGSAPISENDYDVMAQGVFKTGPAITGNTEYTDVTKVYIWSYGTVDTYFGVYSLSNIVTDPSNAPEGYANAVEITLTENSTLTVNPYWNNGPY